MDKVKKLDALFIGAHPDDIELTSAGTLLKLANNGYRCGIIDLTLGELSTGGNLNLRKKETQRATKILGVKVRENLAIPDGDIQNTQKNRFRLIRLIRKYQPEIVFAPFPFDRHPDHINAGILIREAVYFSGLAKLKIDDTNPFRPKKVFYFSHTYDIPVSFIVDISDTFKTKLKSIKAYSSQFYNPKSRVQQKTFINSKLYLKNIEVKARYYGFKIGVEFGEPFYSPEPLNIDIHNLFKI
ncbi:MAG: bacillithiol biosynthesis deacetylase BshB1 [Ignavibacteria bacterium]|nr:bacillithiol biosynthesis deacetylase BshB1 [Ignavibacteria bacterium]